MSKKKRRFENRRTRSKACKRCCFKDSHHLCYQRNSWVHPNSSALRHFHYCIVEIPKNTLHRLLHQHVLTVPEPKSKSAAYALAYLRTLECQGYISENDPIEKRLGLLIDIFKDTDPLTADGFRAQLRVVHEFYRKPP